VAIDRSSELAPAGEVRPDLGPGALVDGQPAGRFRVTGGAGSEPNLERALGLEAACLEDARAAARSKTRYTMDRPLALEVVSEECRGGSWLSSSIATRVPDDSIANTTCAPSTSTIQAMSAAMSVLGVYRWSGCPSTEPLTRRCAAASLAT
jgi:hypothetical protein